jgi:DNA-binding transcriptional ArsR family regulator
MLISEYNGIVSRAATTTDVFNALAESHRRDILDALIAGEKAVGSIVNELSLSQPQVSKGLQVLSEVGLVKCRADGRRRMYRLEPEHLRPLREWLFSTKRRGTPGWIGWTTTSKNYKNEESLSDTSSARSGPPRISE